jgi:hypothetical protein
MEVIFFATYLSERQPPPSVCVFEIEDADFSNFNNHSAVPPHW